MAKRGGTIKEDGDKLVNHAELRVLMNHIATLIAAQDVRILACEAVLPVDPGVKRDADAFVVAGNSPDQWPKTARELKLVPDSDSEAPVNDG
jgi:hypothetical protein